MNTVYFYQSNIEVGTSYADDPEDEDELWYHNKVHICLPSDVHIEPEEARAMAKALIAAADEIDKERGQAS
jgi:hypothetical protein